MELDKEELERLLGEALQQRYDKGGMLQKIQSVEVTEVFFDDDDRFDGLDININCTPQSLPLLDALTSDCSLSTTA